MDENGWGILCGTGGVIFQIFYCGFRYGKWRLPLHSMIIIFLYGVMIPFGLVIITFSLLGKPEIDMSQYKVYFTIAGIALLYTSIHGTVEEIRSLK